MNIEFKEIFGGIEDPRIDRTKLHNLLDIIALGILGIMAGAQSFEEIEDFGNTHEEWLRNYLELENGIPSHDTINRVLSSLLNPPLSWTMLASIKKRKSETLWKKKGIRSYSSLLIHQILIP